MSCFNPILAIDNGVDPETGKHRIKLLPKRVDGDLARFRERYGNSLMLLPCNHCIGCAKDYARMWQARIMCEYEYHDKASFLTLTYAGSAPKDPLPEHLRQFIKAVRNKYGKGVKFFGCGEKGEYFGRSHYHLILFGVDFSEDRQVIGKRGLYYVYSSDTASKLWNRGFVQIGELDLQSAGYVSKYCDKKKIDKKGKGEFLIMSRGLGKQYFFDHLKDLTDSDYLYFKGNKFKLPRYFLKLSDQLDYYHQLLFQDYKDRKRFNAQNYRYGSSKSMHVEEEAMIDDELYALAVKRNQEAIRDVGLY